MKALSYALLSIFLLIITGSKAQITVTATGTNARNCSTCDGRAHASASGGTSPYTYTWSNGATGANISGLCPGTYSVSATDRVGNSSNTASVVIGPSSITDSVVTTSASCTGPTGTATAYVSGGIVPYTYSWSNGATSSSITGLSAGTYTITAHDSVGCIAVNTATVNSVSTLTASNNSSMDASCTLNNGWDTVYVNGGTPPYTYAWSNGATTKDISHLSAGTYYLTVTDNGGCTATDSIVIGQITLNLSITTGSTACSSNAGTASISASGGIAPYTYLWSNGATSSNITGLSAGTYSVTVHDSAGCSGTDSAAVNPMNIPLSTSSTDASCTFNNGTASVTTLGGSPPFTYSWSNGATTQNITGLSAGTYYVTVTDSGGCSGTDSAVVLQTTIYLTTTFTPDYCHENDGMAEVQVYSGIPPFTYSWSNGATTDTIRRLSAGTYTITVTDSGGCVATDSAVVNASSTLQDQAGYISYACGGNNGAAYVNVIGGTSPFTYLWSNGATTDTIMGLAPGMYKVTYHDSAGCMGKDSVYIGTAAAFTFSDILLSHDTGTCNGSVEIVVHPPAGSPVYFSWYSVAHAKWEESYSFNDTIVIDSLCQGLFVVYINGDSLLCTEPDSMFIIGPSGIPSIAQTNSVKLYPNPATNQLTLEINGKTGVYNVEIYNMIGQRITESKNVILGKGTPRTLDISGLAVGQYMLRLCNPTYNKIIPFVIVR